MGNPYFETLRNSSQKILEEKLQEANIEYDSATVKIIDVRSTGVMGDNRAYDYVLEIKILKDKKPLPLSSFPEDISTMIVNKVKGIGRVVYFLRGR